MATTDLSPEISMPEIVKHVFTACTHDGSHCNPTKVTRGTQRETMVTQDLRFSTHIRVQNYISLLKYPAEG